MITSDLLSDLILDVDAPFGCHERNICSSVWSGSNREFAWDPDRRVRGLESAARSIVVRKLTLGHTSHKITK